MAKTKKRKSEIVIYFIIILAIIIILNILLMLSVKETGVEKEETLKPRFVRNESLTFVEMLLPAVDNEGNGVATLLYVEARKGTGKTLIDVDNLLFFADTQHSIRVAKLVAQENLGINISNYDLTYFVTANASIIGGGSAGAALVIATIAVLEGKKPREEVVITGSINRDGSIGPVSDILAKAEASKKAGASTMLVPLLQSRDIVYETTQSCEKFGVSEICTTETRPRKINVSESVGIKIIEVGNIKEAEKYFFS